MNIGRALCVSAPPMAVDLVTVPAASQRVECSWCSVVIESGTPCAPVSHGVCEPCFHRVRSESGLKPRAYPVQVAA